jgi:hypothetical protein
MHLELLVTHETGACSGACLTLYDIARGAHVLRRRATRRAVVCWSLTLRAGPCSLPLVLCARPNALATRAPRGVVARVDTRPLRVHIALARPSLLETLLSSDARCVCAARAAASLACGRRLPGDVCERIARLVLGAHAFGLNLSHRASATVPRQSARTPSGKVLPVSAT